MNVTCRVRALKVQFTLAAQKEEKSLKKREEEKRKEKKSLYLILFEYKKMLSKQFNYCCIFYNL